MKNFAERMFSQVLGLYANVFMTVRKMLMIYLIKIEYNYHESETGDSRPGAGKGRASKLKLALRMTFPPAKAIENRYVILKKQPWLLPFIWPVRWTSVLLFRRRNLKKKQRELQTVSNERVSAYQQALHYVGLGFNFEEPSK